MAVVVPSVAVGQTISPSDDAHVSSVFSSVNFGSAPLLQVGATSGAGSTRAFVKFNLSSASAGNQRHVDIQGKSDPFR